MRFIHETRTVTVDETGGAADVVDVVMPPQDRAFRDLTIWIQPASDREVGDVANVLDFDHETFFGPTSQAAAANRTDDEIFMTYDPGDAVRIWPANEPTANLHRAAAMEQPKGFPITVQLTNNAAAKVVIAVHFMAMTIDQG